MRTFLFLSLLAAAASAQQQPALLSDPPDGTAPPAPEIRYALESAEVLNSTTIQQDGRNITVQQLALDPNDPVIPARSPDFPVQTTPQPTGEPMFAPPVHLLFISATVYPGPFTRLAWTHHLEDGTTMEITGWSNVDWNHFSGVSTFLGTDGEQHSYVMGIGTETEPAANVPVFETAAPIFLPDQQNIPAEALLTVDSLHKLYAIEKEKLAAAHEGRKIAEAAHQAELLANPPQPKDLIIRYRIAETPLENEAGAE